MTEQAETPNPENPEAATAPPPKKKRWGRRLLVMLLGLVVVLLVLVGLAPTIASTDGGRTFLLRQARGFIPGDLQADGLALSWFGGQRIENLRIVDPARREVVTARSLSISRGLLSLIGGGFDFGEITLDDPHVLLQFEEDGRLSLTDTFSQQTPAGPASEPAATLPEIRGQLVIDGGTVSVARKGFETYDLREIDAAVRVDTLSNITAHLGALLPDGRKLSAALGAEGLAPGNRLDLAAATGTLKLATDGEIQIGPLVAVVTGQQGLTGGAQIDVDATAKPGNLQATADIRVRNLVGPDAARPLNLALAGTGSLQGEQVAADVALTGSGSPFATVKAEGTTAATSARISADLAALRTELAQVFDLGDLDFSGRADGTVHLTRADGGYDTQVDLQVGQFGFQQGARDLRAAELKLTHAGRLGTGSETFRSTGSLTLRDLAAGGKPLDPAAEVRWQDLELGDALRAASVEVKATPLNLTAENLGVNLASATLDGGRLRVQADLAKTMQLVAAVGGMAEQPDLSGQLDLSADVSAEDNAQRLAGSGTIQGLTIGRGESAVREEQVTLTLDARIDPQAGTIRLGENRVASEKLTVALQGEIREYTGKAVADISGDYELSWPAITALLHELAPGTRDVVRIDGTSRSPLHLRGPLNDPSAQPGFRGLSAGLAVEWDGIDLLGIPLSAARVEPSLADARLTVPEAAIGATTGRIRIGGTVDLGGPDTLLRMPGSTRLLDGIAVTPELARDLLSRINPIFFAALETSGQVNLTVNDLVLPLGSGGAEQAAGGGKLELVEMRVRPAGLIGDLVSLAGLAETGEMLAIQLQGGDFELGEGRVRYDDFTILFPQAFDLKFRGSVGFDDTLDLVVSVPIRPDLLSRLGVPGDVVRYAEMLKDVRVDLPLTGTRENPQLQFAEIDAQKLLEGVLEGELQDAGKGLLDNALGGARPGGPPADEKTGKPGGGLLEKLKGGKKQDPDAPAEAEKPKRPRLRRGKDKP